MDLSSDRCPAALGTRSGCLIVAGDGRTVWSDLDDLGQPPILAIGLAGSVYPDTLGWAGYHPDALLACKAFRRIRFRKSVAIPETHSVASGDRHGTTPCADHIWPINVGGTSAMFAILAGLLMGHERIILAGCPMDDSGHWYDPDWIEHFGNFAFQEKQWKQADETWFRGRVKSMSGNTRDWLGAP